jgi:ribosomal protein L16/L10AE
LLSVKKLGDAKERMIKKASKMRIRIPSEKPVRKNFATLETGESRNSGDSRPC